MMLGYPPIHLDSSQDGEERKEGRLIASPLFVLLYNPVADTWVDRDFCNRIVRSW